MNQKKIQSNPQKLGIATKSSILLTSVVGTAILSSGTVTLANTNQQIENLGKNQVTSQQVAAQPQVNTPSPANNQLAQVQLTDINGNWAEPFIRTLADKGIIFGYPDGTFRPNQPVTRAEFAALLNRAFDLQPIRSRVRFKDVPNKFWGNEVVNKAYESGFMAGYPNGTFGPNQNIIRIQALVAIVNGTKLTPDTSKDIKNPYRDTDQVPSYGKDALTTATTRCVSVSQEYPTSRTFNPNQIATRADVAALFHQILVAAGRLPALDANNPAQKYIATCDVAVTPPPKPPEVTEQEALSKLLISDKVPDSLLSATPNNNLGPIIPQGAVTIPTAFGSNWGSVFIGAGYQGSTRPPIYNTPAVTSPQGKDDSAVLLGFGLGNSRDLVGLETTIASNSTFRRGFGEEGGISFKLHKQLSDQLAIAGGYENAITFGNKSSGADGGKTGYGVVSYIVNPDPTNSFFGNTTISVGAGGGRFRTVQDIRANKDNIGVFGGIGTTLTQNIGLSADWNGQDLNVGLPINYSLGGNSSLLLVPSIVDLTNKETGGSRFVLSGGLGFQF